MLFAPDVSVLVGSDIYGLTEGASLQLPGTCQRESIYSAFQSWVPLLVTYRGARSPLASGKSILFHFLIAYWSDSRSLLKLKNLAKSTLQD